MIWPAHMPNILFLDIDGVLNYTACPWHWDGKKNTNKGKGHGGIYGIDPAKVELINHIIITTNCRIVLSSTWRLSSDWKDALRAAGLNLGLVIGVTPNLGLVDRGHEIKAWLDANSGVERYAIVDDDCDMLPGQPLFQTSHYDGINAVIADQIIEYLNFGTYAENQALHHRHRTVERPDR